METLYNNKQERKKEINTLMLVIIQTPWPKKRPNKLPLKNPNIGSNTIKIYITLKIVN